MGVNTGFAMTVHETSKCDDAFLSQLSPLSSVMWLVAVTTTSAVLGAINNLPMVTERVQ